MTPCEKLGYKVGDKFRVVESRHPSRNGSIVTLHRDDGSTSPWFRSEGDDLWVFRVDNSGNDHIEKITMTKQVTLKPGDYVSTEGMTEEQYHAVAAAFMKAGFEFYGKKDKHKRWRFIAVDSDGDIIGSGGCSECKRHLTIDQVLNATNAGGQPQDTLTTTLEQAAEHDAKAKHHAAEHERLMQQAREMLPDGWRLVRDGEPAEDMSDPANWREGDVLKCFSEAGHHPSTYTEGRLYEVIGRNAKYARTIDDDGDEQWICNPGGFRFHRRPNT